MQASTPFKFSRQKDVSGCSVAPEDFLQPLSLVCSCLAVQAVAARFCWGFLNGNIGVVKTYVSEITDETNIAKALGVVAMQYGFGSLLGPSIGGFLARPAQKYALFADSALLTRFPYVLPCTVPFVVAVSVLVGIALFLPESRDVYAKAAEDGKAPAAATSDKTTDKTALLQPEAKSPSRLQVLPRAVL